ncbi:phage protease [Pseudomonas aeruginosa]|uniref:phage protease n=1 Tax=Pseudomonas aeruginosa TaxID=287 RepID=UPI0023E10900|nr:phage protease [Pseudomonas aeruginosa]
MAKDASVEQIAAATSQLKKADPSQKPDPAKFVPLEAVTDLQEQIAALTARLNGGELDRLVGAALQDGRLLPSLEQWARDLGGKDIGQLKAYLDKAAPIAALTRLQGRQPEGDTPQPHRRRDGGRPSDRDQPRRLRPRQKEPDPWPSLLPALISALKTSFQKHFQDALATAPSTYLQVATVIPSTTASNTYGWLGSSPSCASGSVSVSSRTWGPGLPDHQQALRIDRGRKRTDIEDDNLGVYGPLMQEMGRAAGAQSRTSWSSPCSRPATPISATTVKTSSTPDHPVYPNVDGTGTATTVSNLFAPGR